MNKSADFAYLSDLAKLLKYWPTYVKGGSATYAEDIFFEGLITPKEPVPCVMTARGELVAQVMWPHAQTVIAFSRLRHLRSYLETLPGVFAELEELIEAGNRALEAAEDQITNIPTLRKLLFSDNRLDRPVGVLNPLTGNLILTRVRVSSKGLLIKLPDEIRDAICNKAASEIDRVFRRR